MSPEPLAADRTYLSLKRDIVAGKFAPGTSFNLHRLADEFGTSITPVRDSIHRLVGERLLGVLPGGGFHLPVQSAQELRELYAWHDFLVRQSLATRFTASTFGSMDVRGEESGSGGLARATAIFFELVATGSGNREVITAIGNASERLSQARLCEHLLLKSMESELQQLMELASSGRAAALRAALREYHRRRLRRAERIAQVMRG